MSETFKISTRAACRVVGIDPDNFNTYASSKIFPCAPETSQGKARTYDSDDLLAMWLFRKLLDRSYSPKSAGHFACEIAGKARSRPDARHVSMVETVMGSRHIFVFDDPSDREEWDKYKWPSPVHDVTTFNVKRIREVIAARIEQELGDTP